MNLHLLRQVETSEMINRLFFKCDLCPTCPEIFRVTGSFHHSVPANMCAVDQQINGEPAAWSPALSSSVGVCRQIKAALYVYKWIISRQMAPRVPPTIVLVHFLPGYREDHLPFSSDRWSPADVRLHTELLLNPDQIVSLHQPSHHLTTRAGRVAEWLQEHARTRTCTPIM